MAKEYSTVFRYDDNIKKDIEIIFDYLNKKLAETGDIANLSDVIRFAIFTTSRTIGKTAIEEAPA